MTERTYGNVSGQLDRLRRFKISDTKSNDITHLVMKPDCVSCQKNLKGVPNTPQCNAICGKVKENKRKHVNPNNDLHPWRAKNKQFGKNSQKIKGMTAEERKFLITFKKETDC